MKKAAAVFVPLGKYGAGQNRHSLVGKTSFSFGNSVTGNFVQLGGGRQLWEEPSSSRWWKSLKSEIVQGTTFAISRMVDGFQIYSFSLKMSDSWVRGRRWGSLMGNPSQSSYCSTTLSVTPRSNWKIAQNSISTWEHQISTSHLRIVCSACHIDMCGKNLPLYIFQFKPCDEKQRDTLSTDPGFAIIDININITWQLLVSYSVQHFSILIWRLFGEDCRKMFDFPCFGLSVSMDSLPASAVTKIILK